jgi:hypothetical protein
MRTWHSFCTSSAMARASPALLGLLSSLFLRRKTMPVPWGSPKLPSSLTCSCNQCMACSAHWSNQELSDSERFPQSVSCQARRLTLNTNQTMCIQYLPEFSRTCYGDIRHALSSRHARCSCKTFAMCFKHFCIAPTCIFRPSLAHRHVDLCRMVRLCRQSPLRTQR